LRKLLLASALGVLSTTAMAMPDSIGGLSAVVTSSTSVTVSWSAIDGASYYDVYQDNERISNLVEGTSYTASGLAADTAYQFFVTACDADGVCSEASPQANVTTASAPVNACGVDGLQPVVTAELVAENEVLLSWCAVDGAEGYNLFVDNEYVQTVGPDTLSLSVPFSGSESYQIAYFGNGEFPPKSDPVSPASVEPPAPPPSTDFELFTQLESGSQAGPGVVEIFFTRHAEKQTELSENEDGSFTEVCGDSKCSEILNAKGELRADLLVDVFSNVGITARMTHAFSSHKTRTRQTIEKIVAEAGLTGDVDKLPNDGIQEYPAMNADGSDATELNPESTSPSEDPTIAALMNLPEGSVALVAGHSGTLYDIMTGIGLSDVCLEATIDTCNQDRYPINEKFKVANFGDIWKVTMVDGVAQFVYRVNLQPAQLELIDIAD